MQQVYGECVVTLPAREGTQRDVRELVKGVLTGWGYGARLARPC